MRKYNWIPAFAGMTRGVDWNDRGRGNGKKRGSGDCHVALLLAITRRASGFTMTGRKNKKRRFVLRTVFLS